MIGISQNNFLTQSRESHRLQPAFRKQQVGRIFSPVGNRSSNLTVIVNTDVSSLRHRSIIAATIDKSHRTAFDFKIGFRDIRSVVTFTISIVAVTATKQAANKDIVQLSGNSVITLTRRFCCLRTDANKGVVFIIIFSCILASGIRNAIACGFVQFIRYIYRRSDGSGNIITAIDGLDEYIVIVSTDMDKSATSDICLAGTTKHVAANNNLRINIEH